MASLYFLCTLWIFIYWFYIMSIQSDKRKRFKFVSFANQEENGNFFPRLSAFSYLFVSEGSLDAHLHSAALELHL